MLSPLNIKIIAGSAALIAGIFGGAYVAGAASADATAPVLGSATPSRVESPSPAPMSVAPAVHHASVPAPKHKDAPSEHSKKHPHRDDANR